MEKESLSDLLHYTNVRDLIGWAMALTFILLMTGMITTCTMWKTHVKAENCAVEYSMHGELLIDYCPEKNQ